jgi:hypothetical protein
MKSYFFGALLLVPPAAGAWQGLDGSEDAGETARRQTGAASEIPPGQAATQPFYLKVNSIIPSRP